jgi:hypothetical protein
VGSLLFGGEVIEPFSWGVRENYYRGKFGSVKRKAKRRNVPLSTLAVEALDSGSAQICRIDQCGRSGIQFCHEHVGSAGTKLVQLRHRSIREVRQTSNFVVWSLVYIRSKEERDTDAV